MVAAAEANGRRWDKNHYKKAELAASLASDGVLATDVKVTLLDLNDRRKDAAYGTDDESGDDELDLRLLLSRLRAFVQEVTSVVDSKAP